ncbi:hypothetical protein AGMMS50229_03970 [Campylobacterota bacterium]|nr:hypothetical protein AGMMS50229_03970 [Campylobacterota bacterium]
MIKKLIDKIIFPFLRVAYTGIATCGKKSHITTRIYQNRKMVNEQKLEFDMPNGTPSQAMFDYLSKLVKRNNYVYLATALSSINQGAIPSANKDFFNHLGVDTENIIMLTQNDSWSIYASRYDIEEIADRYEPIDGLDFVFPIESLIDFLRLKMDITISQDSAIAFIVCDKASATISIYQNKMMIYSSHFIFDDDDEAESTTESPSAMNDIFDDMLSVNDINEEIQDLDAISDDFNSIEDINDYMGAPDMGIDTSANNELGPDISAPELDLDEGESQQDIRRNILLFNFVKNSFNAFYKNDYIESSFVSSATIFYSHSNPNSLSQFMNNELAIESTLIELSISETLCDLAMHEAAL